MDVWGQIAVILPQKEYSDSNLKAILRGWCNLLNDCFVIPNEREVIFQVMYRTLQKLKIQSKEDQNVVLEALRCMLHNTYFNVDELNRFLAESRVPYHYVLKKDLPLLSGEFKSGYKRGRKKQMNDKYNCLFISHAYADHDTVDTFVEFLTDIGVPDDQIFYSSWPEYGVDLGENIVDTIKIRLSGKKVHVIFMLSQNYYNSAMCLNEMGAAWILQHSYTSVLLPGFEYENMKGAIDTRRCGMKLDENQNDLKVRLIQFRNQLQKEFCLPQLDEMKWNRKLDRFLSSIEAKNSH